MHFKICHPIVAIVFVTIVLMGCVSWHTWRLVSQDGASGGGFGPGGRGLGFSIKTYESSTRERVTESSVAYISSVEARKDFEDALKGPGAIVERQNDKLLKTFAQQINANETAKIYTLDGERLRIVSASSLELALAFERSWLKLDF